MNKPRLFSYCITVDSGAAPNPFGGICTLVICKPVIRRVAAKDDWIVATGSSNSLLGDISNKVVYAMKISQKMLMEDYNDFCQNELAIKIPDWNTLEYEKMVGDCIYDFNTNLAKPPVRKSVHSTENRDTDLSGKNALLSNHFYYFGNNPQKLPNNLFPIIKRGQGHKSDSNDDYFDAFVDWIESNYEANRPYKANSPYGEPLLKNDFIKDKSCISKCSKIVKDESENDEIDFWYEKSPKEIKEKIKKVRLSLKLSQKEFADKLNIEGLDIYKIKALEAGFIPIEKELLYKIKEVFNVNPINI